MRRFYAFLIMAFSILAVVLFNVQSQYELFNYGLEYSTGSEITYKITPNEDSQNFDIQNVAKIFNDRLEEAGAKDYYVYSKNDEYVSDESNGVPTYEITVRLSGLSTTQRNVNILRSVENYGTFWLTTQDNRRTDEGDDIIRGTAKIEYNGSSASVVVETTTQFKEDVGSKLEGSTASENDEDASSGDYIILWSDYVDNTDSYEAAVKGETVEQKRMKDKIIAVLDSSSFNKDESKLTINAIGFVESGTSTQTLNSSSAHSIQRLLNEDPVDFKIERLYERTIEAQYGNNSALLVSISAIVIIAIASIVLIACYGINGVAGSVSLILSSFLTVVLYNSFLLSVTPAFVVSFIASVAVCMVILSAYFSRFKNELYKGRKASKANKESFKASVSTALDATVFTLITTIILALLSKNSIQNFSLYLIIGTIFNVLICLFITRIQLYFIANSKLAENKKIFRVDTSKIPNLAKDESQTYFGNHESFDSTKHQKKSFISLVVLALISIVSISVFTLIPGTSTFAYSNEFNSYTAIQIIDTHGESFKTNENVIEFYKDVINKEPFEVDITVEKDPNDLDNEASIYYINAKFDLSISEIETYVDVLENTLIGDNYNFEFSVSDDKYVTHDAINYFEVVPHATTKNFNNAILLIGLTAICTIVYCFVRFRYIFALSSIITTISTVLVTTGILVLSRIPVSPNLGIALLGAVLIVTLLEFIVLVRYGQLKSEQKNKVFLLEDRKQLAAVALKRSITSLLIVYSVVMVGSLLMLIISPIQMFSLYLVTIIGSTVGLLSILFLFIPIYNFSEKHLAIKFNKKKKDSKKNKKNKVVKTRRTSREVEEIIVPGIND